MCFADRASIASCLPRNTTNISLSSIVIKAWKPRIPDRTCDIMAPPHKLNPLWEPRPMHNNWGYCDLFGLLPDFLVDSVLYYCSVSHFECSWSARIGCYSIAGRATNMQNAVARLTDLQRGKSLYDVITCPLVQLMPSYQNCCWHWNFVIKLFLWLGYEHLLWQPWCTYHMPSVTFKDSSPSSPSSPIDGVVVSWNSNGEKSVLMATTISVAT